MQAVGSARGRWLRSVAVAALVGVLGAAGVVAARWPLGPTLIEVNGPDPGATLPNQAVEVFIGFPHAERTLHETLQVRLNGADVTDAFEIAGNGAFGSVVLLVDGENELQVGVFGRSWWPGSRVFEHRATLRFRVRRAIDIDWA